MIKKISIFILFSLSFLYGCSKTDPYPDDGIQKKSIADFRNLKDGTTDWYKLAGEVISIADEEYGVLYLMDDTDYICVYGLASEKDGSNGDFPELGIKAGDRITIVAQKRTRNGNVETDKAYLENRRAGTYPGIKADKALSAYVELPATSGKDGLVYVCHYDGHGKRNFSAYFDTEKRLSSWVCYPYCSSDKNDPRPDSYAYDPLIGSKYQANLKKSFQKRTYNGEEFIRGHMLPNASRGGRRQLDSFLSINIMPQSSLLNTGIWSKLEAGEREWVRKCDTLYVVVGTDSTQSRYQVEDNSSPPKKITVPNAIYRAVLAYDKKSGTYKGMATYFENRKSSNRDFVKTLPNTVLMSIDKLEEKLGIDLFVNLPDDVEKAVEAANPADDPFWWN